jgi:DNA-binding CsgD family transcriptional regulator
MDPTIATEAAPLSARDEPREREKRDVAWRVARFSALYGLSPRECQVLELIGEGRRPKDVASLIGCGYASVRTHLRRMYKKVGCAGMRELVIRFFSEPL